MLSFLYVYSDHSILECYNLFSGVELSMRSFFVIYDPDVVEAKKAELENWIDLEAVDWVEDKGQKLISTRWVITEKEYPDGEVKPKARLVIRGFEENEDIQADAPTASKTALRIVLALAANYDWSISTVDVKAAFLQGRPINRDIYIKPPREVSIERKIWRLRKTAYGLVDAARNWFLSVKEELLKLSCKQSHLDKAVFRWYYQEKLEGVALLHVDDFFLTGSKLFNEHVVKELTRKFKIGKRKSGDFRYVGLKIKKEETGISVNQDLYAEELEEVRFDVKGRSNIDKLDQDETRLLRGIAGQIDWISSQTRPDVSFDSLELSVERNKASKGTLKRANKVARKIKMRESEIFFPEIGELEKLEVYSDAGFCNLSDGLSSTQGQVILLRGHKQCCVLDWSSVKIKRKVSSTLEAEALSLKGALDNAIYIGSLLSEFISGDFKENKLKVEAFTNNKPVEQSIRSTKQAHEKRLRVDLREVQRLWKKGRFKM